jgi:hypothetical protein
LPQCTPSTTVKKFLKTLASMALLLISHWPEHSHTT